MENPTTPPSTRARRFIAFDALRNVRICLSEKASLAKASLSMLNIPCKSSTVAFRISIDIFVFIAFLSVTSVQTLNIDK